MFAANPDRQDLLLYFVLYDKQRNEDMAVRCDIETGRSTTLLTVPHGAPETTEFTDITVSYDGKWVCVKSGVSDLSIFENGSGLPRTLHMEGVRYVFLTPGIALDWLVCAATLATTESQHGVRGADYSVHLPTGKYTSIAGISATMPGYHAIYPTVVPEEKEVFFDMERHDLSQSTFERKVVSENMPEHRRAALDPETLQVREVPMAARPLRNLLRTSDGDLALYTKLGSYPPHVFPPSSPPAIYRARSG